MMEGIWLGVCCLSGWLILPTCLLHQYHFINQPLTWNEAQTYCRQKYTDLATIENTTVMSELESLLSSLGHNSDIWFGLYSKINWKWSDGFTGSGAEYRNWEVRGPTFAMERFCVYSGAQIWKNTDCDRAFGLLCYTGNEESRQFHHVNKAMNWSDAQQYCRENYVDLATVTSDAENQQVRDLTMNQGSVWIGLFRDPELYWSDGSSFSWSNFKTSTLMGLTKTLCGFTSLKKSMEWRLRDCGKRKTFVCHGVPVKKQVVKLRIDLGDSSVDLNDPAVKAAILEKLQQRLKENGVNGVNLKWREQPDGKVFHKEEDEGTSPACEP